MTKPKMFLFTDLQNFSRSHRRPAVAASAAHGRVTDTCVKAPGLAGGADGRAGDLFPRLSSHDGLCAISLGEKKPSEMETSDEIIIE